MWAQAPVIEAESGSVAVIGCTDIVIVGTPSGNPNLIEWYKVNVTNPVQIGGTTYSPISDGSYYVVFPWYTGQSNTVDAEVHTPISITSSGGLLSNEYLNTFPCYNPINLTSTTNSNYDYTNLLWTRNGNVYEAGEYGVSNIQRPGVYRFELDGPCGTEWDDVTINYNCDAQLCFGNTYSTGGIITSSTSISNEAIGGTLEITGTGTVVLFTHENLMLSNSTILVTNGAEITLDRAIFRSCDTWKGIVNNGGKVTFIAQFGQNAIYDAECAFTNYNASGLIEIEGIVFEDNGMHIASKNSNYDIERCNFKNIVDRSITHPITQATIANKTTNHPMIFADNSTISFLHIDTFDQRDKNLPTDINTVTAIELFESSLGNTLWIEFCDNLLNGVVATNSNSLNFSEIHFGSIYANTITPYTPSPPYSKHGFTFNDCVDVNVGNVTIYDADYGIQFYNNESTNPHTAESEFINVTIGNSSIAGIVLAPDANPITNTDPTLNTDLTPMKVDIVCSRIYGGDYGIIGSGKKTDFEGWALPYSGTKTYNQTDPSIDFNIGAGNAIANILWSEHPSWNSGNKMKYYSSGNYPYSNQLEDVNNFPSGVMNLDGQAIQFNNYDPSVIPNPNTPFEDPNNLTTNGVFCQPTWMSFKKSLSNEPDEIENSNLRVYPNPVNSTLWLDLSSEVEKSSYNIRNSLGVLVLSGHFSSGKNSIDVNQLPAGLYTIRIRTDSTFQTIKFVKH